ncbi:redoxin family protein [Chitinophaga sp. MM2321]|uniref:redoxin family protein n=1 Tax=Chitinophaga sp. MM2321 TaxID=3137178 RepID=UPI0032D56810
MLKSALYLTCTVLFTTFQSIGETPLEPGAAIPKPETRWLDISGKEISLNTAKGGNGLLVIFAGNRCPYMLRNQERLHRICTFARKNNIGVVLVNSNEASRAEGESLTAMKDYAAEQQYAWYYIIDKNAALADAFDASHTPESYLFDKNSRLVYKGALDDSPGNANAVKTQLLQNAMNEMLAGKAPAINSSNSLGCNIKRRR